MPTEKSPIGDVIARLIRIRFPDVLDQPADKVLADDFGVNPAAYSTYKQATRKPSSARVKIMAEAWAAKIAAEDSEDLRSRLAAAGFTASPGTPKLISEIADLLKTAVVPSATQALRDAAAGSKDRKISVAAKEYGVFSHDWARSDPGRDRFFGPVSNRLFKQMGAAFDAVPFDLADIQTSLENGSLHAVICYFAAPNRHRARFYLTPLKMSLGAVTLFPFFDKAPRVADALMGPRSANKQRIRPIVARNDVAYFYCRDHLKYQDHELEFVDTPAVGPLLERLNAYEGQDPNSSAPIPVVIADQYIAIQLLAALKGDGVFCLPLSSERSIQKSDALREIPVYYMGFAFPREGEEDLWDLMKDSLDLFLGTEIHTTANALAETFWSLQSELEQYAEFLQGWAVEDLTWKPSLKSLGPHERRIFAREFALRTLSLDHHALGGSEVYSEHWNPILHRAREVVRQEMVGARRIGEMEEAIHHILGKHKRIEEQGQALLLARLVDGDDSFTLDKCRGMDAEELLNLIRVTLDPQYLLEEAITVDDFAPADWDHKPREFTLGIEEVLNQLATMYADLPNPLRLPGFVAPTRRIGRDVRDRIGADLREKFRGFERIVVAQAGPKSQQKERRRCVGAVFLKRSPDLAGQGKICEIKYLWVIKRYRRKKISHLLLGRALDYAQEARYQAARACILPHLDMAIERFRDIGFSLYDFSGDRGREAHNYYVANSPGRLIFERKLASAQVLP